MVGILASVILGGLAFCGRPRAGDGPGAAHVVVGRSNGRDGGTVLGKVTATTSLAPPPAWFPPSSWRKPSSRSYSSMGTRRPVLVRMFSGVQRRTVTWFRWPTQGRGTGE